MYFFFFSRERWDYYKEYILTTVVLSKKDGDDGGKSNGVSENPFEKCHQFLCELIEMDVRAIRGPYLGRIELHKEMTRIGCDAVALLGDIVELLVEYFRLFGDKPCCANDIVMFLDYIEPIRHAELASQLLMVCEISPTTLPSSVSLHFAYFCPI